MKKCLLRIVVCAGLLLLARAGQGAPSVPLALNYQGRLQTEQALSAAGTYGLEVRLWSAATGGALLWARAFPVFVASNGVFNVTLNDAGTELLTPPQTSDLPAAFAGGAVFLGLTVATTPSGPAPAPKEISPVRPFLSVPYSLTAHLAEDAHQLGNVTNLLSRSGNWPAVGPIYALGLTGGPPVTASPLVGQLEVRSDGLWLGSRPVTFAGDLVVPVMEANALLTTGGFLALSGPIRMLQLAGQPSGRIDTTDSLTATATAPQDGLIIVTLPVWTTHDESFSWRFSIRIKDNSGMSRNYVIAPTGFGDVQTRRSFPVTAGTSITMQLDAGFQPRVVDYAFLPFGAAP